MSSETFKLKGKARQAIWTFIAVGIWVLGSAVYCFMCKISKQRSF